MLMTKRSPLQCAQVRELLPQFVAEALEPVLTGRMRFHLLNCEACAEAFEGLLKNIEQEEGLAGSLTGLGSQPVPPLPETLARIRPPRSLWERLAEWVAADSLNRPVVYAQSAFAEQSRFTARKVPSGEAVELTIDWGPDLMPDGHFQMGIVAPPPCTGQELAVYLRVPAETPEEPEEEWGPLTARFTLEGEVCVAFVDEPAPGPSPDGPTRQRVPLAWLRAEVME